MVSGTTGRVCDKLGRGFVGYECSLFVSSLLSYFNCISSISYHL